MPRKTTLKDIANATGVHVSTVSRALNPNLSKSLTAEVVERVRAAANEMGYRPNRLASGLRTNRTMSIGIMLPDITNTLFPPIVRGAETVLEARGYTSIIVNTDGDADRAARMLGVLLERGVDGIIDAAVERHDPLMEDAIKSLPVVTANRRVEQPSLPSATNDDAAGVASIVNHLVDMGHRQIAHIAGPQELSTGKTRLNAFLHAAKARGLNIPQSAIQYAVRFEEEEGRRCTKALLDSGAAFTAIACANDGIAIGAIDAMRSAGLSCPDDISVTGFNDMPFLDRIPPALTTVRVQQFEVGRVAAKLLLELIDAPDTPTKNEVLPVELIKRDSVAPLNAEQGN